MSKLRTLQQAVQSYARKSFVTYETFSSQISQRMLLTITLSAAAVLLSAVGFIARAVDFENMFEPNPIVFSTAMPQNAMSPGAPFQAPEIEGSAAIVYDLAQKKILFGKNEGAQLPLASLTKLMTAYVATKTLPPDTQITITEDRLHQDGDPMLATGDVWSMRDLLGYTLLESSNDGARAIAGVAGARLKGDTSQDRQAFVAQMNSSTQELGLLNTYFKNETGLDTSMEQGGAYGSARDIALLVGYLWKEAPELLEETSSLSGTYTTLSGTTYIAENTNQHVGEIPALIASKTGYTDLAGGNLAVVFDTGVNHPIAIVVLGSSSEGRFADTKALTDATLEYFTGQSLGHVQN